MDFQLGAPPDEIFDNGQYPFGVTLVIENVGEEDVVVTGNRDFAVVTLVGIDPVQFGLSRDSVNQVIPQDMRGAAKLSDGTEVPGDIAMVSFPNDGELMSYKPNLEGTDEILLRAEICYDYRTRATSLICIKDRVLDNLYNDKICSINEPKVVQNSGAPVHVTALKQIPQGKSNTQVTFTVEHVGSGMFFKQGSARRCDDSITNIDQNQVYVKVRFADDQNLARSTLISCPVFGVGKSEGMLNLFQGQPREVSCIIKGDPTQNRVFQDVLLVELDYTYLNFVEKPIIIRDVATEEDYEIG
ncbi:MAG: hypothetical protein ABIH41_01130 [Nanoarchaeota archaeon]